ncbi:ribonuclease P, protein component [Alcanivorax hongdengensis A-11-3]|uniref:Ribonuclease P protein component n=1 Tax=Alcanivorax hongdengensis A-11-3 TaxID=1177179 RepID=L0WA76_9GAMM|nr:ribonuclease P protein component [Alcanivorax hongdengensis]EKF73673.1 ribonuclease P, protein component [Alcanivorax hongdengensis A-11-3]
MPDSLAFTRQQRLLTGAQYQAVFDKPSLKISNAAFLLLVRENPVPEARLGLVIGRKRARRAVDRARIKRRAREQFRLRQHDLAGLDIIFLMRGNLRDPDPALLTRQLAELFDKLLAKRRQA